MSQKKKPTSGKTFSANTTQNIDEGSSGVTLQEIRDIEDAAFYLTTMLAVIHPGVNKDETMELVVEMLSIGLDEDSAKAYGEAIRNTASCPASKTQH